MTTSQYVSFESIDSTNDEARRRIAAAAAFDDVSGTVLVASHQTRGKGRHGRSFVSLGSGGIYMSFILRFSDSQAITVAAAVAVCRALMAIGIEDAQIKWVNDIFVDGKKVCGILAESMPIAHTVWQTDGRAERAGEQAVILGIGLNTAFDYDNEKIPTVPNADPGTISVTESSRDMLIREIISQLHKCTNPDCLAPDDALAQDDIINEYRMRSMLLGKKITVHNLATNEKTPATALDIADDGGLKVLYENGSTFVLHSGEVSVRP